MSTTEEIFAAIAPGLASDPAANLFFGLAAGRLAVDVWGIYFSEGVAYLAAHMLTMRDRAFASGGGASGPTTSRKAGDLAESYGSAGTFSNSDSALSQTTFGLMFLELRRMLSTPDLAVVYP